MEGEEGGKTISTAFFTGIFVCIYFISFGGTATNSYSSPEFA